MADNNFKIENNSSYFMKDNIKVISIVLIALILIAGIVFACVNILDNKKSSDLEKEYLAYKSYYAITAASSDEDIKKVIDELGENEKKFSSKSPTAVRINFYKADLYDKIGDIDSQIDSLEKVVNCAKKENYLLPISIYNLAILYENKGDIGKAIETYSKVYDLYKKDSELSDRSLFALFRIYYDRDKEKANYYKDILEKDFENSEYAKFLLKFV